MRKEFKSIPIEQPVWKQMHHRKLDSGDDVYVLVAKAWACYVNPLHAKLEEIIALGDPIASDEAHKALLKVLAGAAARRPPAKVTSGVDQIAAQVKGRGKTNAEDSHKKEAAVQGSSAKR